MKLSVVVVIHGEVEVIEQPDGSMMTLGPDPLISVTARPDFPRDQIPKAALYMGAAHVHCVEFARQELEKRGISADRTPTPQKGLAS